jgi:hypothetical protein
MGLEVRVCNPVLLGRKCAGKGAGPCALTALGGGAVWLEQCTGANTRFAPTTIY